MSGPLTMVLCVALIGRHARRSVVSAFVTNPLASSSLASINRCHRQSAVVQHIRLLASPSEPPPDFTIVEGGDNDAARPQETARTAPSAPPSMSWKERNVAGRWESDAPSKEDDQDDWFADRKTSSGDMGRKGGEKSNANANDDNSNKRKQPGKNFRDDFRGTRVFVQGLPLDASWQDLKDHFRVAGEVVFASVSVDGRTGKSKGCGVVQFETTDMAKKAIRVMRDHPLDGKTLYVREDYQEQKDDRSLSGRTGGGGGIRGDKLASIWRCADEDNAANLDETERESILNLVKARDAARRRRNYDASDSMREELKVKFNVHLDDRLKLWWKSVDGAVPEKVSDVKGEGRWGAQQPWRQIPTTPENDACVDPDLVDGLLKQRDIARREKDFSSADALLEQARTAPDGDLNLRIHDESRTWRVWTEAPPPKPVRHISQEDARLDARELCLAIVAEHDPGKKAEVTTLLTKFRGREFTILKKLKERYGV